MLKNASAGEHIFWKGKHYDMGSGQMDVRKEYIRGKGTTDVWGYKVNGRETSTNAGRILKQPFIVEYDERSRGPGANKLYWTYE